jgi:starvation-inducible outer membrane lipoprotein
MTILKVSFFVICLVAMLSGCATTNQNAQQQSATPTTISGYIDVGAGKSLK